MLPIADNPPLRRFYWRWEKALDAVVPECGARILCALSGGCDSTVLAWLLLESTRRAAESLGLEVHVFGAQAPHEFEPAFEAMTDMGIEAFVELNDVVLYRARKRIVELAARHRIPGIYEEGFTEVGGLMSYGLNFAIHVKPVGAFVDAILKGADPGQLPVQQPTVFELIINLGAAKELGLTIPQSILLRADKLIR